jgi:hypothetical protein
MSSSEVNKLTSLKRLIVVRNPSRADARQSVKQQAPPCTSLSHEVDLAFRLAGSGRAIALPNRRGNIIGTRF